MRKQFILISFIITSLISLNVYAKYPISAVCDQLSGTGVQIYNGKISINDEKISAKMSFVFNYEKGLILDNQGSEYLMIPKNDTVSGYFSLKTADFLITFFPKDKRVLISKHTYWKPLPFNVDMSSWTIQGVCKFEY